MKTAVDILQRLANSPAVLDAIAREEQTILDQRAAAVAELERLRTARHDEWPTLTDAVEEASKARDDALRRFREAALAHTCAIARQYDAGIRFDGAELKQQQILRQTAPPELGELLAAAATIACDARAGFNSKQVQAHDEQGRPMFSMRAKQVRVEYSNAQKTDAILARCKHVRDEVERLTFLAIPKVELLAEIGRLREFLAE